MNVDTKGTSEQPSAISDRLTFLRKKNKMTLEMVAERFKVNKTTVLRWESEKFWKENPSQNKRLLLLQLIELYQSNYHWILTGNEFESSRSTRVMVVDDDATSLTIMTLIIKSILSPESDITSFTNAASALEWAAGNQSALVFCDYRMPGLKGDHFIMSLRKLPAYLLTPIIGVTQVSEPGVRESMIAAGADFVLQKPLDEKELSTILEQIYPQTKLKNPGHIG